MSFDGVFVAPDRLVGETPGQGLKQAGEVFGYTRLMVAAMALGAAEAAMETAIQYANTRVQFQSVLSKKQGYTHKLILPHVIHLAAADAYIGKVAKMADAGKTDLQAESGMAKLFATEAADKAAGDFMQALGGYGYMAEYQVEKIKRDIKITCIYEGTSEIQQSIISTLRWRKQVKSKGGFYADKAGEMGELSGKFPDTGASLAADALAACGHTMMLAHENRFTRRQHLMFRMADMMTWAEVAAALCQKAADHSEGPAGRRLGLCARIFAAEAANKAAETVRFMAFGTGALGDGEGQEFLAKTRHDRLMKADRGMLPLMDELAGLVFGG